MQFELEAKKSLGQNFLKNTTIIKKMVAECVNIANREQKNLKNDLPSTKSTVNIVEIGPGTGALTEYLLETGLPVTAIEADDRAIPLLSQKYASYIEKGVFTLQHKDIRVCELENLPQPYVLVANIPYYLTGYIFKQFLESKNQPIAMIVMVQKEVAKRVCDKKQSLMSLSANTYGEPRVLMHVSKGNFVPAPKVDSSVLIIDSIKTPKPLTDDSFEKTYWEIAKKAFGSKRKQLGGTLINPWIKQNQNNTNSKLSTVQLETLQSYAKKRPEELKPEDWIILTKIYVMI